MVGPEEHEDPPPVLGNVPQRPQRALVPHGGHVRPQVGGVAQGHEEGEQGPEEDQELARGPTGEPGQRVCVGKRLF